MLRIAKMHNCSCGTYERCACLTVEVRSGKSLTGMINKELAQVAHVLSWLIWVVVAGATVY